MNSTHVGSSPFMLARDSYEYRWSACIGETALSNGGPELGSRAKSGDRVELFVGSEATRVAHPPH